MKGQIRKMTPTRSTNPEFSEEEFDSSVQKANQVEYQIPNGMPGLKMRFGSTNRNVKWTLVIPSPVFSRTRPQTLNRTIYLVSMDSVHLILALMLLHISLPAGRIIIGKKRVNKPVQQPNFV